ncbi:MAG: nitrate reductase subunit beta, partial [Bilophila sp.]
MKIKAQIGMVLNLDKCLACHTCSIPCKNAWTTAPGTEYMWFNNVETKPGIGYPKEWENQERHKSGWVLEHGKLCLRSGSKKESFLNLFANPHLPELDVYYVPWDDNYARLTQSPPSRHQPAARPRSAITGKPFNPQWGVNWEDDLGGAHVTGLADGNFKGLEARACLQFDQVFMLHLPRLCEHCLNPACVASCPSGAIYKRDEDGIVLVDQTRCRSWRLCVSGCPYKKIYFNWKTHHAEKCLFCYPRVEAGEPTLCAHSCVGRIRYMGVVLYDADRVHEVASTASEQGLYEAQLSLFLDPEDPAV